MLKHCELSMKLGDMGEESQDTTIHFASILTTDTNPTAEDIDNGNRISNAVMAADMDTYSFYDCVKEYDICKVFLSVKGVSVNMGVCYTIIIIIGLSGVSNRRWNVRP